MPTFTFAPQYGASGETKPKVTRASFGDGYEQRMQDGINNLPRTWSLTFMNNPTDAESIESFFIARKGVESFDWTPPTGSAGKWVCETWKRDVSNPAFHVITTSFREVFGE